MQIETTNKDKQPTPLLINLYGGPGAGKSTMMAQVYAALKHAGVSVEMAPEFAKELTWQNRQDALHCQPYVFGEQLWRIENLCRGGVEVIVTDSPLLLSCVYGTIEWPPAFYKAVVDTASRYRTLNYFVRRTGGYEQRGRNETLPEALAKDAEIEQVLQKNNVSYREVTKDPDCMVGIAFTVLRVLRGPQS